MNILPNPLLQWDTPLTIVLLLTLGAVSSFLLAIGRAERISAIMITVVLSWIFARNPLIANPSLPVVGWMLVMTLFIPKGNYGAYHARSNAHAWANWHFPKGLWVAAWIMLCVAYTYSGYTKLLSPSWIDGTAVHIVLNNPLARDHFLREWVLALPDFFLQALTLGILWIEVLFLPLALFRKTRIFAWSIMFLVQFGFLTFLNFADLTFPMLLIHALTLDPRWLPQNKTNPTINKQPAILFFDGFCAFCNSTVRFLLAEDQHNHIKVASLEHPANQYQNLGNGDDSIIFVDENNKAHFKTDAVIGILMRMGGVWPLAGMVLNTMPNSVRNAAYDAVGRIRYGLAGRLEQSCQLLPKAYQANLLPQSSIPEKANSKR